MGGGNNICKPFPNYDVLFFPPFGLGTHKHDGPIKVTLTICRDDFLKVKRKPFNTQDKGVYSCESDLLKKLPWLIFRFSPIRIPVTGPELRFQRTSIDPDLDRLSVDPVRVEDKLSIDPNRVGTMLSAEACRLDGMWSAGPRRTEPMLSMGGRRGGSALSSPSWWDRTHLSVRWTLTWI